MIVYQLLCTFVYVIDSNVFPLIIHRFSISKIFFLINSFDLLIDYFMLKIIILIQVSDFIFCFCVWKMMEKGKHLFDDTITNFEEKVN